MFSDFPKTFGLTIIDRLLIMPPHEQREVSLMGTRKLTVSEVDSLVSRLEARGNSILMKDQPEQARDMLQAAMLLRRYLLSGEIFSLAEVVE